MISCEAPTLVGLGCVHGSQGTAKIKTHLPVQDSAATFAKIAHVFQGAALMLCITDVVREFAQARRLLPEP